MGSHSAVKKVVRPMGCCSGEQACPVIRAAVEQVLRRLEIEVSGRPWYIPFRKYLS
ncbi:MAG: hypothetical protein LBD37_00255 [Treponema sp.]|nr:hypothetical protein [Treponema sp.]